MSKKARPVIYDKFSVKNYRGDKAMTLKQAQDYLGWEECEEKDAQFWDYYGKPVRCNNLVKQRHMSPGWMKTVAQTVLKRHWRWTGQTISIGQTKIVVDGQNRLFGFVWACQEWNNPERQNYWKNFWKEQPRLEVLVAIGVDEDEETINAYDQVRPRSLTDVLERSPYFAKYNSTDRRAAARVCADAVRLLWDRTGAKKDPYAPRQTNTESMDFVARHEDHLLQAVRHVYDCNKDGQISCWLGLGTAAGLLYLMGCSASNPKTYFEADPSSEKYLDWENWDKAKSLWSGLADGATHMEPVRDVLRGLGEDDGSLVGSKDRIAVFCKAWSAYLGGPLSLDKESVTPLRAPNPKKANILCLAESPRLGGIDTDVMTAVEPPPPVEEEGDGEVESDEIAAATAAEKRKEQAARLLENRKKKQEQEGNTVEKILEELHKEHPGRLLVLARKRGDYAVWGTDATTASKILGIPIKLVKKHYCVEIPKTQIEDAIEQLKENRPLFVENDEDGFSIQEPKFAEASSASSE